MKEKKSKLIKHLCFQDRSLNRLGFLPDLLFNVCERWLLLLRHYGFTLLGFDHLFVMVTDVETPVEGDFRLTGATTFDDFYREVYVDVVEVQRSREEQLEILNRIVNSSLILVNSSDPVNLEIIKTVFSVVSKEEFIKIPLHKVSSQDFDVELLISPGVSIEDGGMIYIKLLNRKSSEECLHELFPYSSRPAVLKFLSKVKIHKGSIVIESSPKWKKEHAHLSLPNSIEIDPYLYLTVKTPSDVFIRDVSPLLRYLANYEVPLSIDITQ